MRLLTCQRFYTAQAVRLDASDAAATAADWIQMMQRLLLLLAAAAAAVDWMQMMRRLLSYEYCDLV